jgi:phosphoribosylamine--glycine ligase
MEKEGCPFKGCLYFGLMLTPHGPMVIEYNCRFGDPEAQVVLPLLETDFLEIMEAVTDCKLADINIRWSCEHAACVVLASGGYPQFYKTGFTINGLDASGQAPNSGVVVYHAGTEFKDKSFITSGGRVLGVTSVASTLSLALEAAYKTVNETNFEGVHFRKDIGKY